MFDCIIIGSGPAGLSAALAAKRFGLNYLVLERGIIAETVSHFPIAKTLFSSGDELELMPGYFKNGYKPTREELLTHYTQLAADQHLVIHTGEEVTSLITRDSHFDVATTTARYTAGAIIAAMGGFGRQRRLGVPGEDASRVSYTFAEPFAYSMKAVLVVGGGNSAAEATLSLAEAGAIVSLVVRRPTLDLPADTFRAQGKAPIKPWVRQPLEQAISRGQVRLLTSANLTEIKPDSAVIGVRERGTSDGDTSDLGRPLRRIELPCHHIFALIGADPDTRLLEDAGVAIAEDGRPIYDPLTYETNVPGLFVAGHLTRERHMKNARQIARNVVEQVASRVLPSSVLGGCAV